MSAERLPPIAEAELTEEQREAAQAFKEGRGYAVHGPFAVMLRSPEVMLRAKAMGDYLRFRNVLPRRVSEMVILITAREWTQQFEWTYHYRYAMEAGLAPAVADAIGEGRRPDGMADDEAAAYELAIELHHRRSVSDATYARALALFGGRGRGRPHGDLRVLQPARHDDERGPHAGAGRDAWGGAAGEVSELMRSWRRRKLLTSTKANEFIRGGPERVNGEPSVADDLPQQADLDVLAGVNRHDRAAARPCAARVSAEAQDVGATP